MDGERPCWIWEVGEIGGLLTLWREPRCRAPEKRGHLSLPARLIMTRRFSSLLDLQQTTSPSRPRQNLNYPPVKKSAR